MARVILERRTDFMADIIILTVVFGFSGYALFRGIKKRKHGACSSCPASKSCTSACDKQ